MILHGDCLEKLKELPDKSIDMVLADPPYGTTTCKWDVIIPFEPLWVELRRVVKPKAAICLFGSEPFSSRLRMSNIENFKYDWILEKTQGIDFQLAKKRPMKRHEICSVFSYGTAVYYPQGLIACEIVPPKRANGASGFVRINPKTAKEHLRKFTNYPTSIIPFPKIQNKFHPTQKPVALLEYLIKTYTNEDETILDFCMGSGSALVAAKNINRKFIGIEREAEYVEIARKRLECA